jgi:hypothetical protein
MDGILEKKIPSTCQRLIWVALRQGIGFRTQAKLLSVLQGAKMGTEHSNGAAF